MPKDISKNFVNHSQDWGELDEVKENGLTGNIFQRFFEEIETGMAVVSIQNKWITVNKYLCTLLKISSEELLTKSVEEITHPDDFNQEKEAWQALMNGFKGSYTLEKRLRQEDGNFTWVMQTATVVNSSAGKPLYVAVNLTDIGLQKTAEKKAKDERTLWRIALDSLPINVYAKDLKSRKILVNAKEREYMNASHENEILGKDDFELFPKDSAEISVKEDQAVFKTGVGIINRETYNFKTDGSYSWFLTSKIPFTNDQGVIDGLIGLSLDITEPKQIQMKLRQNEELFQKMVAEIQDYAIFLLDVSGNIQNWNKGAQKIKGYTSEEITGKNFSVFYSEEDRLCGRPNLLLTDSGLSGRVQDVSLLVRKDGTKFWANVIITTLYNDKGEVVGYSNVTHDLTRQKLEEEKLHSSIRLEAKNKEMEQLVYITSHDLREPVLTIINFIDILLEDFGDNLSAGAIQYTRLISNAANRMDELIKGLMDYSRLSSSTQLEAVNSLEITNEVITDLRSSIQASNASIKVSNQLPTLSVHRYPFKILIQNLVDNAIKFGKKDLPIEIRISAQKFENGWKFEVADNGIGIADTDKDKIFMMFQRLHDRDKYPGTGIGLAHCRKIVDMHQGHLWVESEPGKGSQFYFTINL